MPDKIPRNLPVTRAILCPVSLEKMVHYTVGWDSIVIDLVGAALFWLITQLAGKCPSTATCGVKTWRSLLGEDWLLWPHHRTIGRWLPFSLEDFRKGVENVPLPVGTLSRTSVKDARDRDPQIKSRSSSGFKIVRSVMMRSSLQLEDVVS